MSIKDFVEFERIIWDLDMYFTAYCRKVWVCPDLVAYVEISALERHLDEYAKLGPGSFRTVYDGHGNSKDIPLEEEQWLGLEACDITFVSVGASGPQVVTVWGSVREVTEKLS